MINPYVIAFLVMSVLTNAGLGYALKGAWEDAATAQSERSDALASAKSCSDGVAAIEKEAKKRQADAEQAVKLAREQAKAAVLKAQQTLALRPTNPSDLCASAVSLSHQKIKERVPK